MTPWARSWFEGELPTIIFTADDVTIGVSDVSDVEGELFQSSPMAKWCIADLASRRC